MATLEIPLRSDLPNYDFSIALNGVTFIFTVLWNARSGHWTLSIADASATTLVAGIPLLINQDLFSRLVNPLLPPGIIVALDTSGAGAEPEQADIGGRVVMLYLEAA